MATTLIQVQRSMWRRMGKRPTSQELFQCFQSNIQLPRQQQQQRICHIHNGWKALSTTKKKKPLTHVTPHDPTSPIISASPPATTARTAFLSTAANLDATAPMTSAMTETTTVTTRSKTRTKKILFHSLGCPRNFVDTEVMMGITTTSDDDDTTNRLHFQITTDLHQADYIVLNTCGFLESARLESNEAIRELLKIKRRYAKLIVTGCMVNLSQQSSQQLNNNKEGQPKSSSPQSLIQQQFPQISAVLGSGEIHHIRKTIEQLEQPLSSRQQSNTEQSFTVNTKHKKMETSVQVEQYDKNHQNHQQDMQSTSSTNDFNKTCDSKTMISDFQKRKLERQSFLEQGDTPRFVATPPHYSYLKIAEGCKKQCSFCIIPKIKGPLQSKPVRQLVDEFHTLLQISQKTSKIETSTSNSDNDHNANGCKGSEIILIAQDLGDYGKDLGDKLHTTSTAASVNGKIDLTYLLQELLQSTSDPNLWLRLLYLYPDEITTSLLDLMESDSRICRYLDMPIQHSHDDILKKMRRGTKTNSKMLYQTIDTIRQRLPNIKIRTSLMVGFPGETEAHFNHLLQFVQDMQLDHVGVFRFSEEPLADATRLSKTKPEHFFPIPDVVKEQRYQQLMETQLEVVKRRYDDTLVGTRQHVVVEGLNDQRQIVGRYYGQCPDVDGQVIISTMREESTPSEQHLPKRKRLGGGKRYNSSRRRDDGGRGSMTHQTTPRIIPGHRYWVDITGYQDHDLIGKLAA